MAEAPNMPDPTETGPQAHRLELLLSRILRGGVLASTLIVLAGLLLTFFHHPGYVSDTESAATVIREMAFPHSVPAVLAGLLQGQGRAVIVLGLFLLIATPVARVAMSVLIFLWQRDRPFVVFTIIVLTLLVASFFIGRAGG
jgi:uncharacterized membrane protein